MYMNWNIVLFDTFLGALIFGTISVFSQIYINNTHFYKILAFIWGVPLTFFFFINMVSRAGIIHVVNFSKHAIIGTLLTVFLAIITIGLQNTEVEYLVYLNFILALFFVVFYFYYKVYEVV